MEKSCKQYVQSVHSKLHAMRAISLWSRTSPHLVAHFCRLGAHHSFVNCVRRMSWMTFFRLAVAAEGVILYFKHFLTSLNMKVLRMCRVQPILLLGQDGVDPASGISHCGVCLSMGPELVIARQQSGAPWSAQLLCDNAVFSVYFFFLYGATLATLRKMPNLQNPLEFAKAGHTVPPSTTEPLSLDSTSSKASSTQPLSINGVRVSEEEEKPPITPLAVLDCDSDSECGKSAPSVYSGSFSPHLSK